MIRQQRVKSATLGIFKSAPVCLVWGSIWSEKTGAWRCYWEWENIVVFHLGSIPCGYESFLLPAGLTALLPFGRGCFITVSGEEHFSRDHMTWSKSRGNRCFSLRVCVWPAKGGSLQSVEKGIKCLSIFKIKAWNSFCFFWSLTTMLTCWQLHTHTHTHTYVRAELLLAICGWFHATFITIDIWFLALE